MLDNHANQLLEPILAHVAQLLSRWSITANMLTITGFAVGVIGIILISMQYYLGGLVCLLINRVFDGLDGALARHTQPTDAGGYLDIVLDFIFYSGFVFAFLVADPTQNAITAGILLVSFMGTGCSFLAFAIMAERHQISDNDRPTHKALVYAEGITEGTETILFFILCCLWPNGFIILGIVFATLCWITTLTRIINGYRMIHTAENQ